MENISMIGLDIAKQVFQVHGIDAAGEVVARRKLGRGQVKTYFAGLAPCVVGMEACGTAHYWARELQASGPVSGEGHLYVLVEDLSGQFQTSDGRETATSVGKLCKDCVRVIRNETRG